MRGRRGAIGKYFTHSPHTKHPHNCSWEATVEGMRLVVSMVNTKRSIGLDDRLDWLDDRVLTGLSQQDNPLDEKLEELDSYLEMKQTTPRNILESMVEIYYGPVERD